MEAAIEGSAPLERSPNNFGSRPVTPDSAGLILENGSCERVGGKRRPAKERNGKEAAQDL